MQNLAVSPCHKCGNIAPEGIYQKWVPVKAGDSTVYELVVSECNNCRRREANKQKCLDYMSVQS